MADLEMVAAEVVEVDFFGMRVVVVVLVSCLCLDAT